MSSSCRSCIGVSPDNNFNFFQNPSAEEVKKSGGGKAFNLDFLSRISLARVPLWGFISHFVFRKLFFDENAKLFQLINELSETCKKNCSCDEIAILASKIRKNIKKSELDSRVKNVFYELFIDISENGKTPVAVRSSATMEDGVDGAFAGLYDSILNQKTFSDFVKAVKKVWASSFSNRSIQYQIKKQLDVKNTSMGIIVQKMISAVSSGTAFSIDVTTGYQGVYIVANFGVEGIVGGEVGDTYLYTKNLTLIKRSIAEKQLCHRAISGSSGTEEINMSEEDAKKASLSLAKAREVAEKIVEIKKRYLDVYGGEIDTEFCLSEKEDVHFLQIRPVVDISSKTVYDLDFEKIQELEEIAEGKYSIYGVTSGRVKIIKSFSELESKTLSIEPDDIVVAHRTENQWSQFFTKFKGIISMEGNPTAHPMLVAREHGVSCVIGVKDAVERLMPYNGEMVTLDGFRKKIYRGIVPVKEVCLSQIKEMFETVKPEILPDTKELVEEAQKKNKMFVDDAGDVWFVKPDTVLSGALLDLQLASFPIRQEILNATGVTPQITISGKQKTIGKKVYERLLGSLQEQLDNLKNLKLEHLKRYFEEEKKKEEEYLAICENFSLTVESFRSFCESYKTICAYMWLSFIIRTLKLDRTYSLANQLDIPKMYFSECEAHIQSTTLEEDVVFKKDMKDLYSKLLEYFAKSELESITVKDVKEKSKELYEDLFNISRKYRFTQTADWKKEPPLSLVLKRVIDMSANQVETASSSSFDFFAENPELLQWTELSTQSKIQQNNLHHKRVRGQWPVRDKLVELEEKIILDSSDTIMFESLDSNGNIEKREFRDPQDILDATSKQIEEFILKFA